MNKLFISSLLILIFYTGFSQNIIVNNSADTESNYTPEQLVENVLISGACAMVDNFYTQVAGAPTDSTTKSYGYFKTPSGSSFPFEEGIVISSGKAYDAGNTIISSIIGTDNLLGDDNDSVDGDLNDVFPGVVFNDATVIEFDFVPFTEELNFRFILASEEYVDQFPCIYSDGFAFLLRDTVTNTITNIALVPDSEDAVSTMSIHPEILNTDGSIACFAQNETYFEGYHSTVSDTNFNGRTVPMNVMATVIPNRKYRIKMVVADAGDSDYDSAIFLEAGSFNLGDGLAAAAEDIPKIGACDDNSVGDNFDGFNLFDLETNKTIILNGQSSADYTLTYFEDDAYTVQIPTLDVNTYQNLTALQTIYVQMTNNTDASCFDRTSFEIEVFKLPEITYLVDLLQCDDDTDGFSILNLNTVNAHVSNNYETEFFTFYENKPDAEAGTGSSLIVNPNNYYTDSTSVFVRVENQHCYVVGQVDITISVTNTTFTGKEIALCDDEIDGVSTDQDGISEFDLTQFTSDILAGIPIANQSDLRIKFYHTFQDAQLQQNVIVEPTKYRNLNTDTFTNIPERIFIRVENVNNLSCVGLSEDDFFIDLIVKPVPFFDVKDKDDLLYCTNWLGEKQPIQVEGYLTNYDYVWKDANGTILETDPIDDELAYFTHAGDYTVTAINSSVDPLEASDCEKTIAFTVKKSSLPIIKRITIDDNLANNTVSVIVTGDGDYQFALDNDDFKDPNIEDGYLFNHVIEGAHLIRIKDVNGCSPIVEKEVIVIRFPKHISPEDQNGQFDTFYVYGGEGYMLSSLYIYDKFGKVMAHLQNNEPWDGTYLGKVALQSDYWFNAIFVDAEGKTYKRNGYFSLIRP